MSNPFDVPAKAPTVLAPEGKHTAILYLIADLGHHKDTYDGVETIKHKIYLAWELVGTKMEDGRPYVIGKEYTVSPSKFHEGGYYFAKTSNIYKIIKSWGNQEKVRTDPGVLVELLNSAYPATINIEHQIARKDATKTYAVIDSVKPYKGKDKPVRVNEPVDGISKLATDFEKLPEWIKKRINSSLEKNGGVPRRVYDDAPDQDPTNGSDTYDFDIPF